VMERFERVAWPAEAVQPQGASAGPGPRIDVAEQLRRLW
jgi:hypothetical protein